MSTQSEIPPAENRPNIVVGILKRIATLAISLVLIAVILFLAAGRLDWIWAWVYLVASYPIGRASHHPISIINIILIDKTHLECYNPSNIT